MKRWWLLIERERLETAGAEIGQDVVVRMEGRE